MLEELLSKRVIVVSTQPHSRYKHLDAHYVGTLLPAPQGEVRLSDWNDRIFCYYNTWKENIGLDTRPTNRSKEVVVPQEKVRHVHALDESKLTNEHGATKEYVFHLWIEGDK